MGSYGICPKCKTSLLRSSGAGGCNCTCELCGYHIIPIQNETYLHLTESVKRARTEADSRREHIKYFQIAINIGQKVSIRQIKFCF